LPPRHQDNIIGFRFRVSGVKGAKSLYETSHSWNSEPQNIECRTAECRRMESLSSVFFKIDRSTQKLTTGKIPYFDIRHSLFDIRFFRVSFSIRLAAFRAGGGADT
jgi:hypothetical protein